MQMEYTTVLKSIFHGCLLSKRNNRYQKVYLNICFLISLLTQIKDKHKNLFKVIVIMGLDTANTDINTISNRVVDIPRAKGLIGILILNKTGSLFYSKVNKKRVNIIKNIFQIAGFLSAMMIYSKDFIGSRELELKLEDVDLHIDTKNGVIFAYLIEKENHTEDSNKYIHIIFNDFLERYYDSHIKDFKGDLTPFYSFEEVIDQYFDM